MIWAILIAIVAYSLFRFFTSLEKDKDELREQPLSQKFGVIAYAINQHAFNGNGEITNLGNREFNIYQEGQNQIIYFQYSTGHLTITWKYKYLQKEVVHKKQFNDVRNISLIQQQRMADTIIAEMTMIILNHQDNVLRGH